MQTTRRSNSPNGRLRNAWRRFADNATNRRDTALLDVARSVTSAGTGSNVPACTRRRRRRGCPGRDFPRPLGRGNHEPSSGRSAANASATVRIALAFFTIGIAVACGDDRPAPTGPTQVTPPQATRTVAERLVITGPADFLDNRELEVGQTVQLHADLEMSDDSVRENIEAEWSSSNTTVATIDSSGLVTARQAGRFDIRATAEGLTARLTGVSAVSPPQPKFDDRFWRELVYDAHDKPGDLAGRISWVMPTTSPNVYIRTTNLEPSEVDYMRREIPRIVHQVTGAAYAGRVEHGPDEVERHGWITVRTVTRDQAPEFITGEFCGYAYIGDNPGKVWLVKDAGCRGVFPERILAHELGHALGLYHVGAVGAVMQQFSSAVSFSDDERHHGKLAYRAGRGAAYCGNPETCAGAGASFAAVPVFVVN